MGIGPHHELAANCYGLRGEHDRAIEAMSAVGAIAVCGECKRGDMDSA